MKRLALALLISVCLARIGPNDVECETFTGKFGTAKAGGVGTTKAVFSGEVSFTAGTSNLSIKVGYSDDVYFNDPKFKGLTKEDGISNDLTCLDLKLLKFPDSSLNPLSKQEITDLTPVASADETTKWRYLTYSIPGEQLKTRLVQSESTANYVYTGYYALAYYVSTQIQFTFYFTFSVTVNKATSAAVDAAFLPISDQEALACQDGQTCNITPSSSVEFCSDSTCTTTTTAPKIYLNNNFWLIQKITTAGITQNYLSGTKVHYVGSGLNKLATIEDANYSVAGQAIYRMKATIAWDKVSIQANSIMKTSASSGRRILAAAGENESTYGKSSETCIMLENGTECPSCSEIAASNTNGDAPSECSSSKMLLLIAIVLIGLLF